MEAHHCVNGRTTGRNSGGRGIIKKVSANQGSFYKAITKYIHVPSRIRTWICWGRLIIYLECMSLRLLGHNGRFGLVLFAEVQKHLSLKSVSLSLWNVCFDAFADNVNVFKHQMSNNFLTTFLATPFLATPFLELHLKTISIFIAFAESLVLYGCICYGHWLPALLVTKNSSLHWYILGFLSCLFIQWSIFPLYHLRAPSLII